MVKISPVLVLLFAVLSLARGDEVCCDEVDGLCFNDDPPFEHLPLPECPDDIEISMMVYTRTNPDDGEVITRTTIPPSWNENIPTYLIVHGWLGNKDNRWMHSIKDDMLEQGDYNVIITGWEESSQQIWYPRSASDTRSVGAHMAAVYNNLVKGGGHEKDFYCTGHSLGSHVCGHSGSYFTSLYDMKMSRITGMDPAGPLFEDHEWSVGLNPDCADQVDIMHTHGETNVITNLGTMKVLGHVDFYPNGGGSQPGCILDPYIQQMIDEMDQEEREAFVAPDLTPACSHLRAVNYYEESILNDCFMVRDKCSDNLDLPGSCWQPGGVIQSMGFHADGSSYDKDGIFYVPVEEDEPHCLN